MRPAAFATVCFAALGACESDTEIGPVTVQWMDWPAEVAAGTPFAVRLVVFQPCAWTGFRAGLAVDQSAVTFAPYFLDVRQDVLCALRTPPAYGLVVGALDTVETTPGLAADFPRTYEVRAAASVYAGTAGALSSLPVRTFGQVIVRPSAPDPARRNAAGIVLTEVDTLGCLRIRPLGAYRPGTALVLENLTDTASLSGVFVRGYIYEPATPLCGEPRVFHLLTRN